jgi:hypothetical protein
MGVVGLVTDVATLGESSIAKGAAKTAAKEVAKEVAGKEVKTVAKEAMDRGIKNEAKVLKDMNIPKNNKTYRTIDPKTGKPVNVKPDGVNKSTVTEIKDTKKVSNTKQIRGEREVAKQQGKSFQIVTGEKTKVSKTIPEKDIIRRKDIGPQ